MTADSLTHQVYRANLLVDYKKANDAIGTIVTIDKFPAGKNPSSPEHWKLVDKADDKATGFHARAYERVDAQGNTLLIDGQKQHSLIFPGSMGRAQDQKTSSELVKGALLNPRHEVTEQFVDSFIGRLDRDHPGQVFIGMHSLGALAVGASHQIRHAVNGVQTQTIMLEPFGAGEALEQITTRIATKDLRHRIEEQILAEGKYLSSEQLMHEIDTQFEKEKSGQLSKESMLAIGNDIQSDIISVRSEESSIYSDLKIGDKLNGNAMLGQAFTFKSAEKTPERQDSGFLGGLFKMADTVKKHAPKALDDSLMKYGEDALSPAKGFSSGEVLNARLLTDMESFWASLKTTLYNLFSGLLDKLGLKEIFTSDTSLSSQPETKPETPQVVVATPTGP